MGVSRDWTTNSSFVFHVRHSAGCSAPVPRRNGLASDAVALTWRCETTIERHIGRLVDRRLEGIR
jgi:hypothetical protein